MNESAKKEKEGKVGRKKSRVKEKEEGRRNWQTGSTKAKFFFSVGKDQRATRIKPVQTQQNAK